MNKEYDVTPAQAVSLVTAFLKRSPARRRRHRLLVLAALALACAYSLYKTPIASVGDYASPTLGLTLALTVQIPLVAIFLYFLFIPKAGCSVAEIRQALRE